MRLEAPSLVSRVVRQAGPRRRQAGVCRAGVSGSCWIFGSPTCAISVAAVAGMEPAPAGSRTARQSGQRPAARRKSEASKAIDDVVQQIGEWSSTHWRSLYFAGGEPLMMAEHYSLLKLLVERGRTGVCLRYNTNLSRTEFAGTSIFDLWSKFDRVMVQASVDAAHGCRGRAGAQWIQLGHVFVENIATAEATRARMQTSRFGVTVSALNILSLPELLEALGDECGAAPGETYACTPCRSLIITEARFFRPG